MMLTFADTHNMVAYLTKSDASEGFDQIIDFLNASSINKVEALEQDKVSQALEIIQLKQRVKRLERKNKLKVSGLRRLRKVGTAQRVESSRDTVMDDVSKQGEIIANMDADEDVTLKDVFAVAKEVEVEKDAEIEENADVQGRQAESQAQIYKIDIEYADKYIFDSLLRNVDSSTKFYMYPRFLQLMIRAQVGDLSSHTIKYSSPALSQKVFPNIRRVGKGFSRVETPLFEGMIVAQQADDVADEGTTSVDVDVVPAAGIEPSIPSPTPTTQPPPPSQELPSTSQVVPTPPPSLIVAPS
nr:hypothetical protein [Tanacetum cinerariifolium]